MYPDGIGDGDDCDNDDDDNEQTYVKTTYYLVLKPFWAVFFAHPIAQFFRSLKPRGRDYGS